MKLDAQPVGSPGEAPDDGVVSDDAAWRVVQGPDDGQRLALAEVYCRHQLLDFGGPDHSAIDPQHLVELGAKPEAEDGRIGVAQVQPAHLGEQKVEIQLLGQALVKLQALPEKGNAFGRQVVGANDGGSPRASSTAEVALVQHGDALYPQLAQVVGGGQAVDAASDDDDLVPVPKGVPLPHPVLTEESEHYSKLTDAYRGGRGGRKYPDSY